jgi:hypothetical protein
MLTPVYQYRITMLPREKQSRLDGDTYWVDMDLGVRQHSHWKLRLRNYSCPERGEPGGLEAWQFALDTLYRAKILIAKTYNDRLSHDRWVSDIWVDGVLLGEILLRAGHATYTPM